MKRILFIDDEAHILDGLRDLLRRHRRKWDMAFAPGGQAGLEALERSPFDVVVTDMRMPGIDGAEVLRQVQQRWPEIVRIVLSGYSELEAALRIVPVAHQFLTKPTTAELLENVIERACALQALIGNERVRTLLGGLQKLPAIPAVYAALTRVLADEGSTLHDVAAVLEQDASMCAKLMQLVNSSLFGFARSITSVAGAVTLLGLNTIRSLALSVEVFEPGKRLEVSGFSIEAVQSHALFVSRLAGRILQGDKRQTEDAFMAGLLHDVGKLVLALELPEQLAHAFETARGSSRPLAEVEQELYSVTHAEIGGYLLGLWGLPYPVAEAVANHHAPGRVAQRGLDVLAAVHVADALAHELEAELEPDGATSSTLEPGYLESLGVAGELAGWRKLAQNMAAPRTQAA